MYKRVVLASLICAAVMVDEPARASALPAESALHAQLRETVWPGDLVRLADAYLERYPDSPVAADVAWRGARAARARHALRQKEVQLFRTAFEAVGSVPALRADLRRAVLADALSALRIAHAFRDGDGVAPDADRYAGWLQFASWLGSGHASYELALHYRRAAQMPLAARWEARALEQGFVPPPALDNVRK